MTQAANCVTPLPSLPQSPINSDMLARLKGILGLLDSLAISCGYELREPISFLAEEYRECIEQIEPRVERFERLRRQLWLRQRALQR